MKKIALIMILSISSFFGCDDDDDSNNNTGCTQDSCEEWQTCNETSGICELGTGRCELETDCEDGVETCNMETHTCDAVTLCNTEKTNSGISLPADTCGEMTECIESSDCPENMRCENLPVDGEEFSRACCVEGPRGCSTVGDACTDEFDCDTGLCIARNDGQAYCTTQCDDPADCDDPISECYDMFVMTVCVEPAQ